MFHVKTHTPTDDSASYKDRPGLGNRSIFYLYSSVGNTLIFGVVDRTRV